MRDALDTSTSTDAVVAAWRSASALLPTLAPGDDAPTRPFEVWIDIAKPEGEVSVAGDEPLNAPELRETAVDYDTSFRVAYVITGVDPLGVSPAGPAHMVGNWNAPIGKILRLVYDESRQMLRALVQDMGGRLVRMLSAKLITTVSVQIWRALTDKPGGPGYYLQSLAALSSESPAISGLTDLTTVEVPDEFLLAVRSAGDASLGDIRNIVYQETQTMPEKPKETPEVADDAVASRAAEAEPQRAADDAPAPTPAASETADRAAAPAGDALRAMTRELSETLAAARATKAELDSALKLAKDREAEASSAVVARAVADLGTRVPTAEKDGLTDILKGLEPDAREGILKAWRAVVEPVDVEMLAATIELPDGKAVSTASTVRSTVGHLDPEKAKTITGDQAAVLARAAQHEPGSPEYEAVLMEAL